MISSIKKHRWLTVPIVGVAALAVVGTVTIAASAFQEPPPPTAIDPVYGVCRGLDPACYSDWSQERANRVLVYSRTAGPRHGNLGSRLDPDHSSNAGLGLPRPYVITENHTDPNQWPKPLDDSNVVHNNLIRLLEAEGIEVHVTEDVQAIERLSSSYAAVIFASPTRDTLWNHAAGAAGETRLDRARETLKKYIEGGGGFVGIHNAHGTEYGWQWYEGLLGNSNYYNHGRNQPGDVVIIGQDASTEGLPERWGFQDEWYNLVPFPTNVNFLAVVDDSTLEDGAGEPSRDGFHPVTWCQYYDGGRSWVTTLGHDGRAFEENSDFPGAAEFQQHLVGGIKSAMGLVPFCGEPGPPPPTPPTANARFNVLQALQGRSVVKVVATCEEGATGSANINGVEVVDGQRVVLVGGKGDENGDVRIVETEPVLKLNDDMFELMVSCDLNGNVGVDSDMLVVAPA